MNNKNIGIDQISNKLQKMVNEEKLLSFFIMGRETEKNTKHEDGKIAYGLPHLFIFDTENNILPRDNNERIKAIDYELFAYYLNIMKHLIKKYKQIHCIKDDKEARNKFIKMINDENIECWF